MPHNWEMSPQESLAHFGKKGMRWGVRNAPSRTQILNARKTVSTANKSNRAGGLSKSQAEMKTVLDKPDAVRIANTRTPLEKVGHYGALATAGAAALAATYTVGGSATLIILAEHGQTPLHDL